jgi:hypothetical protein
MAGGEFQQRFQRRWPRLRDPHARALAWLLDASDLMAADAPCWEGRIATLGPVSAGVEAWVNRLQDDPQLNHLLRDHLARQASARLGRYAEKLLGFYLQQQNQLVAANLQVRNGGPTRETLGEFDFLVRRPDVACAEGLEHWEFATKFYLLETPSISPAGPGAEAFVGPNLADSLGRKMRKIMERQLMLSRHPAAAAVLPQPVTSARALVKGWLFYRDEALPLPPSMGIAAGHCRGFWCEAQELAARVFPQDARFVLLPRLEWLAPARVALARTLTWPELQGELATRLALEAAPQMVAVCEISEDGEEAIETERGFIAPDGWRQRAAEAVRLAVQRV